MRIVQGHDSCEILTLEKAVRLLGVAWSERCSQGVWGEFWGEFGGVGESGSRGVLWSSLRETESELGLGLGTKGGNLPAYIQCCTSLLHFNCFSLTLTFTLTFTLTVPPHSAPSLLYMYSTCTRASLLHWQNKTGQIKYAAQAARHRTITAKISTRFQVT